MKLFSTDVDLDNSVASSDKVEEIGNCDHAKYSLFASNILYTVFLLELNKTFLPIVEQFLSSLNVFHVVFFFLTLHDRQKDYCNFLLSIKASQVYTIVMKAHFGEIINK